MAKFLPNKVQLTEQPVRSMKNNSSAGYLDDIVNSFIHSSMFSMSWWRHTANELCVKAVRDVDFCLWWRRHFLVRASDTSV